MPWSHDDRVVLIVPERLRGLYPQLHRANGRIEFISPTTTLAHVALDGGGTAVVNQRWCYTPRKRPKPA